MFGSHPFAFDLAARADTWGWPHYAALPSPPLPSAHEMGVLYGTHDDLGDRPDASRLGQAPLLRYWPDFDYDEPLPQPMHYRHPAGLSGAGVVDPAALSALDFDELLPQTMHYYSGAPGPDRYPAHLSAHPFHVVRLGDIPSAAEWWPSWPLWATPLLLGAVLGIGAWLVLAPGGGGR